MCVNLAELRNFIPAGQLATMRAGVGGEEGEYFRAKLQEFSERILIMPKVYEQDNRGEEAVAYLHYFRGGNDWYITERDMTREQLQAFGVASLLGHYPESGYISVAELIARGVELDLHFEPTVLSALPEA